MGIFTKMVWYTTTHANAQEATPPAEYEDFVYGAGLLDKEDPAANGKNK